MAITTERRDGAAHEAVARRRMYIDGAWADAAKGGTFEDSDPFTGETVAVVPAGTREDARRAIDAAHGALHAWWKTPPSEKRRLLLKAADILERRQQEIVKILAAETGATFGWAMFQSGFTPGLLREAAGQVSSVTGEILPADLPGAFFMATRQPAGVVAGIAPWNAPLILSLRAVALPLAYGNTVVLKPSAETPVAGGLLYAEIFEEAGFPKGVFNVITNAPGHSAEIGDEFIENPKVRRISFTGSTDAGRAIAEKAGRHLKRVALELSGYNPLIVLRDADVDYAVNAACFGTFLHQGQICMSARNLIVERPIADTFVTKLVAKTKTLGVGDPRIPTTVIGPLINKQQLNKVRDSVEDAVKKGAKVLVGGNVEGPCFQPTLLTDVKNDMRIDHEECFGPVAIVTVVDSPGEALRVANDTRYGLSAGIITRNFDQALDMAERLETGMVHINDQPVHDEPQAPFGGVKDSGFGRMGGRAALEEFTELRWITVQREPRQFPF